MGRGDSTNDDETETEEINEDSTESEQSVAVKKLEIFGFPLYNLSYKRLPKKCLKFLFLAVNTLAFVSLLFFPLKYFLIFFF